MIIFSNESVHGERANVTGLVLGLIEADFSDEILTGIGIGIWKALTAIYTIHFDLRFFFSMKCCRICQATDWESVGRPRNRRGNEQGVTAATLTSCVFPLLPWSLVNDVRMGTR